MSDFVLYSYFRSSASYRVRIALNLKGLSYEYRPVHLLNNGGEQYSEDYRQLNPSREVPTLIHKGRPLSQSVAILDYLDRVVPQPALFPADSYAKARVLQACEIVNSGIQPIANLKVLRELERRGQFDQTRKNEWAVYWMHDGLTSLENLLKETAGRYCFGDQVTAADAFLVPQVYNANRFKMDLAEFPVISKVHAHCQELEAFRRAAPEVQPDTPPEMRTT